MEFRFAIAPDKHAVYPDRLRPDLPMPEPCTDAARDEVRAAMAARPEITVDMWSAVLAERDRSDMPLYFSQDSHWTPAGACPRSRRSSSRLPRVWDRLRSRSMAGRAYPSNWRASWGSHVTRSYPGTSSDRRSRSRRRLPTDVDLGNTRDIEVYTTSGSDRVVPGTTLVIYDSFLTSTSAA